MVTSPPDNHPSYSSNKALSSLSLPIKSSFCPFSTPCHECAITHPPPNAWNVERHGARIKSLELEIGLHHLKELCIDVVLIILDESPQHKLFYFAPYPGHLIPEPNDDTLGEAYNGLIVEMEKSLTSPKRQGSLHTRTGPSCWSRMCDEHTLRLYFLLRYEHQRSPHLKTVMYNNLVAKDFSPLWPILRIMLTQLCGQSSFITWTCR